jgi:hypothetical protein
MAYLCTRKWLRRGAAGAIAVMAVGTILDKPAGDFDAMSLNGEILGRVLLLREKSTEASS